MKKRGWIFLSAAVFFAATGSLYLSTARRAMPLPSFQEQICSLPREWLELTRRGYFPGRSGEVTLLPRTPAYVASAAGGWTHTGPWPYLQDVPLVFHGPDLLRSEGEVARPVTLADVAPTLGDLIDADFEPRDGKPLPEVRGKKPGLIVTIVWDGGGWNVLKRWRDSWPNLAAMARSGLSFTNATVGSSPSVTPPVHTTLGTGAFPSSHGVTDITLRDEAGRVVDSFLRGASSRFIEVKTFAEAWDEGSGNRARVGMIGYEPWHLGMIGRGAEVPAGDRDDAAWLDTETNEWITNPDHYDLPPSLNATGGLDDDIETLDGADGRIDGSWRDKAILDDPARVEETPAFIAYHMRAAMNMIAEEGYGNDNVTDLLFMNFKQPDRAGHYFNMSSHEVRDSIAAADEQLRILSEFLDREVGRGRWLLVVTADHGQQPDARDIDAYAIDPNELEDDIEAEFGPVVRAAWPTQIFLREDAMRERKVSVADIARFVGDYRLIDNTRRPDFAIAGAGRFAAQDRLIEMSVPSAALRTARC
jgi:hypothetical protein